LVIPSQTGIQECGDSGRKVRLRILGKLAISEIFVKLFLLPAPLSESPPAEPGVYLNEMIHKPKNCKLIFPLTKLQESLINIGKAGKKPGCFSSPLG
jgi:hypothetical protein